MHKLEVFITQGKEDHAYLLRSHYMAYSNHQGSCIKGLILLCLDMIILEVTVIIMCIP